MSRKLSYSCQGLSNGRCPWICNYNRNRLIFREECDRLHWLHIQAWASALPSDKNRAMREASECRTVTDTDSCAFFIYQPNANEGRTAVHVCRRVMNIKYFYLIFIYWIIGFVILISGRAALACLLLSWQDVEVSQSTLLLACYNAFRFDCQALAYLSLLPSVILIAASYISSPKSLTTLRKVVRWYYAIISAPTSM